MSMLRAGTAFLLLAGAAPIVAQAPAASLPENFQVRLVEIGDKKPEEVKKLLKEKAELADDSKVKDFLDNLPKAIQGHLSEDAAKQLEKSFADLGAKVENKAWPGGWDFNGGDTGWMMVSTALVLLMTLPGLALFYGGLVRSKNVLSVMMQCLACAAVVSILWWAVGYSLCFAKGKYIGGFDHVMLKGVSSDDSDPYGYAASIPHSLFMVYQLMFAIITPGLICGAFAERVKFSGVCVLLGLWSLLVYSPMAHAVWGAGGFLRNGDDAALFPSLDFAGGTVVHITSGVSALVCALLLGKRKGYLKEPIPPHSMVISFIGAGLLWFGWFGFNAGSALGANPLAVKAFIATHFATAAAAAAWCGMEWLTRGKASGLGGISGAVAGLVAITPACGFVTVNAALIIGLAAGAVCFLACMYLKNIFGYDDSLDAFGVHGVGGTLGALATAVFATKSVNPAGLDGVLAGNAGLLKSHLVAIGTAYGLAIVGTTVLVLLVQATIGLRVAEKDEIEGLDLTQHGEAGYHS